MICPNCNKFVFGVYKESGKSFCPHCKCEIVMRVQNIYLFVILLIMFVFPIVFFRYSSAILDAADHLKFRIYFSLYGLFVFCFAAVVFFKNVKWERRN